MLNLPFFILLVVCLVVVGIYTVQLNTENRTKAEDLGPYCDNPPDCCNQIASSGDPMQCDWPWRKYCRPSQCNIPEGVNRQRCGVAYKEKWPYGCVCKPPPGVTVIPDPNPVIYDNFQSSCPDVSTPTLRPSPISIPTEVPTQIILPTTILPTQIPPTQAAQIVVVSPTNSPVNQVVTVFPTAYTAPLPTAIPTPTSVPVLETIGSNIGDFWQKTKESFLKFISVVLP